MLHSIVFPGTLFHWQIIFSGYTKVLNTDWAIRVLIQVMDVLACESVNQKFIYKELVGTKRKTWILFYHF